MKTTFRLGLAAAALLAAPAFAVAGSAPQRACAGLAATPGPTPLILGHFTGGRFLRAPGVTPALDWRDEYTCFTSARACHRWQRDMLIAYRNVEGWRTCMPLR